jgi:hypothetical protein
VEAAVPEAVKVITDLVEKLLRERETEPET